MARACTQPVALTGSLLSPIFALQTLAMANLLLDQLDARLESLQTMQDAGMARAPLQVKAVEALQRLFRQQAGLSMADVTRVTRAINEGPWTKEQRLALATALSDANCEEGTERKQFGGRIKTQTCESLEFFIPDWAWAKLLSQELSESCKLGVMAKVLYLLGLTQPSEKLLKRAGAVFQAAHLGPAAEATKTQQKGWCKEIQRRVKNSVKEHGAYPHGLTLKYPARPDALPPPMFSHAYVDGPPQAPPAAVAEAVPLLVDDIKVRKSAACFGAVVPATASQSSAAAPLQDMGGSMHQMMQNMFLTLASMMQMRGAASGPTLEKHVFANAATITRKSFKQGKRKRTRTL